MLGPLSQSPGYAIDFEGVIRARVVVLLFERCPSAIAGLVVAVHVNPIERVQSRRPLAHIREEGFEVLPSATHFDAPRAVIFP